MKLPLLFSFFIACLLLEMGSSVAADNSGLVMTPLPPGPILPQLPDMFAWQILFSYAKSQSDAGNAANAGKPTPPPPGTESLPQTVSIAQTKPLWHSTIVTTDGKTVECWGTPEVCYLIEGPGGKPIVLGKNPVQVVPVPHYGPDGKVTSVTTKTVGGNFEAGADGKYLLNPAQGNFPDMDWISPQTYVGTQQGMLVFREQSPDSDAAEVRLRADNHFPISWKKGNEVRTFQMLPVPQDTLMLPPDVARVAADYKRAEARIMGTSHQ